MMYTSDRFEACYNFILNNNFPAAIESFKAAYREHPDQAKYLHGIILSYVFLGKQEDMKSFLDAEKNISSHGTIVSRMLAFARKNDFSNSKTMGRLYNVAVFISRRVSFQDAKIYFSTGLLMEPKNSRFLTAVAEHSMIEGDYGKGLSFYVQAAGKKNTD